MKLLFIFILFPFLLFSQSNTNKGIHFVQGLSWEQVKQKAKDENKYIFIDCFATWCKPCKRMDVETYSNDSVGFVLNKDFISIKVQIDTSKNDNAFIKHWYDVANKLSRDYKITSFPTYLFFSPQGNVIHRDFGFKASSDFIKLASDAMDSKKQYYTLIQLYENGNKDYSLMPNLAYAAQKFNEFELSEKIANDYIDNYLFSSDSANLFSGENIEFVGYFTVSSSQKGFKLFYQNVDKINKVLNNPGASQGVLDNIISQEEVAPIIKNLNGEQQPNWKNIFKSVEKKYDFDFAYRIVLDSKIDLAIQKQDWSNYCKYSLQKVKKYGRNTQYGIFRGNWAINHYAWDAIFMHSHRRKELRAALKWMKEVVKKEPNAIGYIDTYANLLYKQGKEEEAIFWESKAKSIDPHNKSILETLDKMQRHVPTWQ